MLRRSLILAGMLLLGSTCALAVGQDETPYFYLGASAAKTDLELDELGASFDASDTTYKAFVGVRFVRWFAIEGGYVDFGNVNDVDNGIDLSVDATAWDGFVVGVLPIGDHFEIFAKYGLFWWDRNAEASGIVTEEESDNGSNPVYGAGLAITWEHFAIRAEYERYEMDDVENLNQTSAGIEFRF